MFPLNIAILHTFLIHHIMANWLTKNRLVFSKSKMFAAKIPKQKEEQTVNRDPPLLILSTVSTSTDFQ